ncbi:MAG: hypothetical protein Crog4KO_31130 [Crocinitomicaceae bacterium]
MIEFDQKGLPILRLHEDYFEVKAIDYWEFRSFQYTEVKKVRYYDATYGFGKGGFWGFSFSHDPDYRLKIYLNNGGDWWYLCSGDFNPGFAEVLREVIKRCGTDDHIPKYG